MDVVPFEIAKLELAPGDILVVKLPQSRIKPEHVKQIGEDLQRFVGDEIKIMLLECGAELTVVRREDTPAPKEDPP